MLSKRTLIFLTAGFGLLSSLAITAHVFIWHIGIKGSLAPLASPWDELWRVQLFPTELVIRLIDWLDAGQEIRESFDRHTWFFLLVFPNLVWGLTGAALGAVTHRVIRKRALSRDPLRAELRRREGSALVARRLEEVRLEAEAVRAQILVLTEAAPDGAPSSWTTEVLRAEIGRRDQLESLQRDYDRLTAEVERLTRNLP